MLFGVEYPQITSFTDEYRWLSNFWPAPIYVTLFGVERNFSTAEHYYQALKSHAMDTEGERSFDAIDDYLNCMQSTETPGKAKRLGQKVNINQEKWNRIAFHYMLEVQKQKYSQNFDLALKLANTGTAEFVEGNTWGDKVWGTVDGEGLNLLGLALEMTRSSLRNGELNVVFK